jgi:chorismate mutase
MAMQQERDNFNRDLREYEAAQGFTPVINRCSQVDEVRARGRDLNAELEKDNRTKANSVVSNVSARNKLKYSSPAKNLRAAAKIAKELHVLSSEALRDQQAQLNELLSKANKQ